MWLGGRGLFWGFRFAWEVLSSVIGNEKWFCKWIGARVGTAIILISIDTKP